MKIFENYTKEEIKKRILQNIKVLSKKHVEDATPLEIYQGVASAVSEFLTDRWINTSDKYYKDDVKIVYYLSMEFLVGRFLGNSILNLSLYDEIKEILDEIGIDYNLIEEQEGEPGLGNGGLGRLAACFMDSISTLNYPAYGCGIRYNYGIFKQDIINGYQVELPDSWLKNRDLWGIKRNEYTTEIKFFGHIKSVQKPNKEIKYIHEGYQSVSAVPYDYPVVGYDSETINTLRLWEAEIKNDFDLQAFNQGNYFKSVEEETFAKKISNVLYPADEFYEGKELRLKQQYFFVSATLQTVLERFYKKNKDFNLLPSKVCFQLNDTHPSMAVPELMRILIDDYELSWNKAWDITIKTCAYTNHTLMSEALEKWPVDLFENLLPRVYMIIEEINKRFCTEIYIKYPQDTSKKINNMAIILNGEIHMARLAIVGSFSINGVAALHTEILKTDALKDFYNMTPEKFNNKTNGITQRRWLLKSNPHLASFITKTIGKDYIKDLSKLEGLLKYTNNKSFTDEFRKIKQNNKIELSNYIKKEMNISVDPDSIFDIQIKRLHEYKRQLMLALYILDLYNKLKSNPNLDIVPRTFIFSAKAAASYHKAKLVIKLINQIAYLINNDISIKGKIKVIFVKNYSVSIAEKLIPAADLSEQISTASKEASGTGNMKFMLNGALTIGTMDGANVEIFEEVGDENIFIFGMSAKEVIDEYNRGTYNPLDIYNANENIKLILTQLINGTLDFNERELFRPIYDSLLNGYGGSRPDAYFILKDYDSYYKAQKLANDKFLDKEAWTKSAIINVAKSGKFSSDRTIKEYARDIWNIKPVK
ncbi:MAG: glycogen/starch/alpha-glucan phosphorylase [Defluviitaleaceae bacterium]|nr:glycogen/starch/alpha-glucan phosphorylase [Defluviitaleaceae bacterium]